MLNILMIGGQYSCNFQDESLFAVMERIVKAEVHRLVVVDDDNKVFFTTENFITKSIFLFADQHTILLIFSTLIVIS